MNHRWQQAQIYSTYAKHMVYVFKARLQSQSKKFISASRAATYLRLFEFLLILNIETVQSHLGAPQCNHNSPAALIG